MDHWISHLKLSTRWTKGLIVAGLLTQVIGTAHALPALQIGFGSVGDWAFDATSETWITTSDTFSLNAYANSDGTDANGDYAWDTAGAGDQYAYLVFAAVPNVGSGDSFDISVENDSVTLSLLTSGYGNPPLEDPNSLSNHGIYDSYFEIYQFQFNGTAGTIGNTQPGDTGTGEGFTESFDVSVNSLSLGALGIHFDLFTIAGNGLWDLGQAADKQLVNAFAPYSHDGGYTSVIPVPAAFWLFGTALIGFIGISRRTKV